MWQPFYKLFGLNPQSIPHTSLTIGIDAPEGVARQAKQSGYPIFKIKLESENDKAKVKTIREATDAELRVAILG